MSELDKALKMFAAIKEHLKEEERIAQEQAEIHKKKHLMAELEEIEIDELSWEERIKEIIREDQELEAQNEHKLLEDGQKDIDQKLKFPSWIKEVGNETTVKLIGFDPDVINDEDALKQLSEVENVKDLELQPNMLRITLDNGKQLQLNPQRQIVLINDFSDQTLQTLAKIATICGCQELDFSQIFAQKANLNLSDNHFMHFKDILTNNGLHLKYSSDLEESSGPSPAPSR